jgi:hypothetical protein
VTPKKNPQVSVSGFSESGASGVSIDRGGSEVEKFLNFSASESDSYDCDGDVARVSSPKFFGSGVSVSSQDSGNRPLSPNVIVVDQRVKVEDKMAAAAMKNSNSVSKRKKEQC